ncbi:MAG: hypothetical protein KBC96_14890 [Armatimonadetes bacterium]|nr:hypothetical protein [Armatimonadota bacterium]
MRKHTCRSLLITATMLLTMSAVRASVFHVASDASGANTGASWADAFTTIQQGIDAAHSAGGGEVWIKRGVYSAAAHSPFTDSFEALDSDSVDVIGEERDLWYTSAGQKKFAHITIIYLKGPVTGVIPAAVAGTTTDQDPFATRLSALKGSGDDYLLVANHPSYISGSGDTRIDPQELLNGANARAYDAMELKNAEDIAKWDYVLANLDDQAGDCTKMVWGIRADDMHQLDGVDYRVYGAMMGCMPTSDENPVYADRRLALKDMIRRGSFVCLPALSRCGMPAYTLDGSGGSTSRIRVSVYVHANGTATGGLLRFYGCNSATGDAPGTLLFSAPLALDANNTVDYYLTATGLAGGQPLTAEQKARIKYIRPVVTWTNPQIWRNAYLQPVRIKSNGDWWNGPAVTLAGSHAAIGPSPYPSGGADTGKTTYFNTHTHTTASDGDSSPAAMRARYYENYGELDPEGSRFTVVTDHNRRTPFDILTPSVVELKEGVSLYGGFAGTETILDQRDPVANPTIIDPDRKARCVLASGIGWTDHSAALIDGLVLRNGRALDAQGGGIYAVDCSPTIRDCVISGNKAAYGGGASFYANANAIVVNCKFSDNIADGKFYGGGAVYVRDSAPSLTDCRLIGNVAESGGAIYSAASRLTVNSSVFENSASKVGGAIHMTSTSGTFRTCGFRLNASATNGGAIYNSGEMLVLEDCEFTSNEADRSAGMGGAVYQLGSHIGLDRCVLTGNVAAEGGAVYCGSGNTYIAASVFAANRAAGTTGRGGGVLAENENGMLAHNTMTENVAAKGGAFFCLNSPFTVANNIVAFNTRGISVSGAKPSLFNNDVYSNSINYEGITPGASDISANPTFVDAAGGNYRLAAGSPCMEAGTHALVGLPVYDFDGRIRPSGRFVDIGAFEFPWPNTCPKPLADGSIVEMEKITVTAAWPDFFYVETDTRSYGIRVEKTAHGLSEGMLTDLGGTMRTNTDGERYIEAATAAHTGSGAVDPIGLTVAHIGGGPSLGQRGVVGGAGVNNIGLLVSTWGRVTTKGDGFLCLDDGSGIRNEYQSEGVRIVCNPTDYEIGDRIAVVGISSCFARPDGKLGKRILTRGPADLRRIQ